MSFHQGRAYAQDLRDRVLEDNDSSSKVAKRFAVSVSYVHKVRARRRDLGRDTPGAQCNHVPLKLAGHEQTLAAQVQAQSDQTLKALCQWAQEERGIRVGISAMWKTLTRLKLTLKKDAPCERAGPPRCGSIKAGLGRWAGRTARSAVGISR